jgi:diguanylate cyclase (GGDEF)-like protein
MIFSKSKIVTFFSSFSIVLITLRHALVILQNGQLISKLEQLNSNLEAKVNERTQELYEMAFYDPLTGLPNRRMFEDTLEKSLEAVKRNDTSLALMFLDLDRFKTINDTLGHSYGDMLLQEVSRRIQRCIGAGYTISRQGGDEFAIIIEGYKDLQEVENIAQQILIELLKPADIADHFAYTTCSIGIALYSAGNSDVPTLMRHADAAMYRSKEIGKNTYQFYNPEMDVLISRKLTIERELRRAIENNEFTLYFQPQINTADNRIIGAEALIRWMHPEWGIVPPAEFIPVAEETGMIELIGRWVLKNACIQAVEWQEHGLEPIKVGVNISPYQLQQEYFIEMVGSMLEETGLQPEYLDLEITEGLSIQNESDIIFKLHKLKRLGVRISIDDFGTGYSSLSYLNKLPINTLKIAQQFVRYIKNDTSSKAIVSAVIAIAKSLKLSVIAEGVENEYQLKFLKSQYCYEMQGYLFSKPVPADEFEKLLRDELQASVLR